MFKRPPALCARPEGEETRDRGPVTVWQRQSGALSACDGTVNDFRQSESAWGGEEAQEAAAADLSEQASGRSQARRDVADTVARCRIDLRIDGECVSKEAGRGRRAGDERALATRRDDGWTVSRASFRESDAVEL